MLFISRIIQHNLQFNIIYTIIISAIFYTSLYLYILLKHEDLLPFFNTMLSYTITLDLVLFSI